MECPQIDLYEFLTDSELHQYYNVIKNELKITNAAQFKYATDEDLKNVGLSRPEIRRLRKYYEKHFPHGYLSKIKRLLQAPATIVKREDGSSMLYSNSSLNSYGGSESSAPAVGAVGGGSPNKVPNNKHIIPADSISVNKQLGTGEFGIVQQGVWTNGTERIQVAIKCLCRERMQSNPMEFLKEAAIMHSIEHENIVRLYGVVLATDSLMLVTELAHLRSLLECLKDSGLRVSFLTVPTLCEFAIQICNGMSYLENKRLIHRDLAARNILVFSKNKVKISDFGLSRALGVGKDYYKTNFNVNLKLPIAWCAPECINYLRFTNASDVWAFGVCLWEMFSYGFQPWAALTGLQILEAIDAPNYQRLEQPDCCPTEYYTLMMKCWQDDPVKRPKFSEIAELLPEMKPEQLKAVVNCLETKNDQLSYRQGDIITVLNRNTGTPFWKGVLNTGKTGYFNPSNTVAYLEGLPSANRESFCRTSERSSKRKLRTEMISKPQNDLKHTGHVGIDGASFGDIAFLGNSQSYNHVPRQIVTPYKPSEDIEQTPLLLPPTPTSPDSLQSCYFNEGNQASGTSVNPSFVSSTENTPKQTSSFQFPHYSVSSNNPFAQRSNEELHNSSGLFALQNKNYGLDRKCFTNNSISLLGEMENETNEINWRNAGINRGEEPHEYHEISDDEMTAEKLDLGPSLLEEINSMFGSMSASNNGSSFDQINIKNEFAEISSKLGRKNSGEDSSKFVHSKKKSSTGQVKQISVKDEKILNQAIEIANEISARSMIDLVSDQPPQTQSPKRKFSFRFPHLTKDGGNKTESLNNHGTNSHGGEHNNSTGTTASPHTKKKNFSEELKSIPDLQESIGEGAKQAYNSLIERNSSFHESPVANLLRNLDTNEFDLCNSKTLPRLSMQVEAAVAAASLQLTQPDAQVTRPMTLPTRGAANRLRQQFSLQNNRNNSNAESPLQEHLDGACESPSYLNNTGYNFPEKHIGVDNKLLTDNTDSNPIPLPPREGKKHIKTNAKRHVRKYPLIIPANGVQRTLNKVTGSEAGEEAGLSQCNAMRRFNMLQNQQNNINLCNNNNNYKNDKENAMGKRAADTLPKLQLGISQNSIAAYENTSALLENNHTPLKGKLGKVNSIDEEHTYQNLEDEADGVKSYTPDTASLQFENILEADFNKGQVLSSPDVTDGFYNFSIQKEQYNKCKIADFASGKMSGLYVNEDELRNLDIDKSSNKFQKPTSAATSPTKEERSGSSVAENPFHVKSVVEGELRETSGAAELPSEATNESELAGNALFKKVRVSCDLAMNNIDGTELLLTKANSSEELAVSKIGTSQRKASTEMECLAASVARLTDSNSVSCEDLLEFSDKKPKGCERGVDSDEVRIMVKVLGKDSTPERCLKVLEVIKWDVHKGIKIMKLQNILNKAELSTEQCVDALQEYDWDLYRTALQLRNLRN